MMVAGGQAGTDLVGSGVPEASNNPRATGRGKKKALRKALEKKPSSYRRDRRDHEEFMRALREEEPKEQREEDEISDYRELWDCLYPHHFGSFDDESLGLHIIIFWTILPFGLLCLVNCFDRNRGDESSSIQRNETASRHLAVIPPREP